MTESKIQEDIRKALTKLGFRVFRCNVGTVRMKDGRYFSSGLCKGFSDLLVVKNGKTYFLEVKTAKGKASKEQNEFMEDMQSRGFVAGIVRSVEDAVKLCEG